MAETQIPNPARYPDVIPSVNPLYRYNSFAHIQRERRTHTEKDPASDLHFDTEASDANAALYRQVREKLYTLMAQDSQLAALKPSADHAHYERRLASLVWTAIEGTFFDSSNYRPDKGGGTTRNLNQLTSTSEYDCEHLCYIRGLLLHEGDIEAVKRGLRTAPTQFFLMSGALVKLRDMSDKLEAHAYIASANTGNILGGTERNAAYYPSNRQFEEIIAGYPVLTQDDVYASSSNLVDEALLAKRLAAIQKQPQDISSLALLRGGRQDDLPKSSELHKAVALAVKQLRPEIESKCTQSTESSTLHGDITVSSMSLRVDPVCVRNETEAARERSAVAHLVKTLAQKEIILGSARKMLVADAESPRMDAKTPANTPEISTNSADRVR